MTGFVERVFDNVWLAALVKVVAVFALLLVVVILLVWIERKLVADMQNRLGPMRAGPFGVLQTLADGLKLLLKESVIPRKAELGVYMAAPIMALIPAFLIFLVIPIGEPVTVGGTTITLQGMDLNVGVLYLLAMSSLAVYAIVFAGWASGSKYPLLGGVRATAQMISYEAAMGLALVPVVLFASHRLGGEVPLIGTMSLSQIVELQQGAFRGFVPGWFVFWLAPSFIIFMIAAVAEANRAPFDLVEAETELVGGFHTEYSGFRFALFFLAEYLNMFNLSAIAVTLFFGGWLGPTWPEVLPGWISALLPIVWFLAKTFVLLFVFIWLRATLPRLRYDQLMNLGWKRLIPASLAWLVLFTVVTAWRAWGAPWSS
ncbi:MAG: NADH-quinone oxidoreductase subunit NuoH [Actinobacteria bacterium]|nr:NADH-quinone oxidoreductase subunit NuoH [Actinomycetota bacterium]